MEIEDDVDDPMEIDDTVQSGQIIERKSDEFVSPQTPPPKEPSTTPSKEITSSTTVSSTTAPEKTPPTSTSAKPDSTKEDTPSEITITKKDANSAVITTKKDTHNVVTTTQIDSPKAVDTTKKPTTQDPEVVILDDDDDVQINNPVVPKPQTTPTKKKADNEKVQEIIDLVDSSINSKCINYSCKSGRDLITAPGLCLSYYRVKCSAKIKKTKEVCKECYDIAFNDYDMLVTEFKGGKLLFDVDVPLRNDMVEIEDSDEESDDKEEDVDYIDEESSELVKKELDDMIIKAMEDFDLETQIKKEVAFLKEKSRSIGTAYTEIDKAFKQTRKTLDRIQITLYNQFRPEVRELKGLNIIDDRSFNFNYNYVTPAVVAGSATTDAQRKFIPTILRPPQTPKAPTIETVRKPTMLEASKPSDKDKEPEVPTDLPRIGPIEKPPLKIGETYYIVRDTGVGPWVRGRLVQINTPEPGKPGTTMYKVMELKQLKERLVTGKQIAYMTPSPVRLEIGTRVLAGFKEVSQIGETKKSRNNPYYPGVVAEPPVASNKYRYLIFFDIGYSQYVSFSQVTLVLESSKNVWEDMSADSQAFIKKYLESQDHPMIKIAKDQTVRTEYNGKWWLCTVMNVDCSLVQVFFDSLNRMEWIFRGSTRLSPIFREEQAATNRQTGARAVPRKLGTNESATVVQYTRNTDFTQPSTGGTPVTPPVRAVARKSTTKPPIVTPPSNAVPFLPVHNGNAAQHSTGPTSKIMYFTPRDQVITKRPYRLHTCSPKCKEYLTHNFAKLRGHNPLSKPLLCGWARMTVKVKGKKEIVYKAPCGRMLRHMGDVHYYLSITKSEMTVDLFDFNQMVRCLAEFSVECPPDPKDLSNALEQVPIPVINGINNEQLDFRNYSIKRVPTEGVTMNLDPDFLCGCDCEDDCIDKTKCACWKLTLEGAKYISKDVDPNSVGYIYRRLNDQVLTGIYECNSRCKCTSTCLNRVAQHPLSLKLQVFRTHNRGWGIRALNDVPQGAFICCYAGTIHTEQMANEDGMAYGDEYFAELDYIESVEKVKEDYESDVPEDDDFEERRSPVVSEEDKEEDYEDEAQRHAMGKNKRFNYSEDNDFIPSNPFDKLEVESGIRRSLRKRTYDETRDGKDVKNLREVKEGKLHPVEKMDVDPSASASKEELKDVKIKEEPKPTVESISKEIDTVTISDDEDEEREILSFNPKANPEEKRMKYVSVRELFGSEESVYVMDAKNAGNIGRFLNHSCSPNVFVQNVFVDTHDPRFPWVAFFSSQFIRAGTELVWNYNYDIGSVNGRVLYCHCASLECKGRLL